MRNALLVILSGVSRLLGFACTGSGDGDGAGGNETGGAGGGGGSSRGVLVFSRTLLGHTRESYSEPEFLAHVAGGIDWAARR